MDNSEISNWTPKVKEASSLYHVFVNNVSGDYIYIKSNTSNCLLLQVSLVAESLVQGHPLPPQGQRGAEGSSAQNRTALGTHQPGRHLLSTECLQEICFIF